MKKNFFVLFVFLTQSVFCALPPLYQTANEIKEILNSENLGSSLSAGEGITDIQKNENGYKITTNKHTVQVDVIRKASKSKRAGPIQFEIEFHSPAPL